MTENDETRMINDETRASGRRVFDLEERAARFGEAVIGFVRGIELDAVTRPIVSQLVRAATSVGANYCEANDAVSKKDFRYKIGLCRKESKETKYWFRMMAAASTRHGDAARPLWLEAKELNLIFAKIYRSSEDEK